MVTCSPPPPALSLRASCLRLVIDVAASEQIIEPADAIPAIAVAFHQHLVPAAIVGAAVVLVEQIDQQLAGLAAYAARKRQLARRLIEIMHEQYGVIAPVVADDEDRGIARSDDGKIAPADFGHFFPHANDALGPVQHGLRIAPLFGGIDMLEAERTLIDHGHTGLVALGETCMRL